MYYGQLRKWHIVLDKLSTVSHDRYVDKGEPPVPQVLYKTKIMTTLHLIETVTTMFTRLAVFTSEMFTITAILWTLNFMGDLIRKLVQFTVAVYVAGQMVGHFYFTHLHEYVMEYSYKAIILTTKAVAFTAGRCVYFYHNRNQYFTQLNNIRNTIGQQFVYA